MDMKKIQKPRMEEYERKKRREREKQERQQLQVPKKPDDSPLFSEPFRIQQSNCDDNITAALGDYSKVKDYISQGLVGILTEDGHHQQRAALAAAQLQQQQQHARLQQLPPPNSSLLAQQQQQQSSQHPLKMAPHHLQQQQQQQQLQSSSSRQSSTTYIKQPDNKSPYNGRPLVKNDVRTSSSGGGMAPPKVPPTTMLAPSMLPPAQLTSSLLPPPATTIMPNGRQSSLINNNNNIGGMGEKSFLGPSVAPTTTNASQNGRFTAPSIPKTNQKVQDKDVKSILSLMTENYCPKPLTEIGATPHNTILDNYNLNGPNKHKYSFEVPGSREPIQPLAPLASPPLRNFDFITPMAPIAPIAPLPAAPITQQASSLLTTTSTVDLANTRSMEKEVVTQPPRLEKHSSTLENDLELSDSDDDRKKSQNHSTLNSSDSSQSDSSDSGSEESSKGDTPTPQQQQTLMQQQQQQHQRMLAANAAAAASASANAVNAANSKKKLLGPPGLAGNGQSLVVPISSNLNQKSLNSQVTTNANTAGAAANTMAPSPTDSSYKWNLSTYFNKTAAPAAAVAPQQQQQQPPPAAPQQTNFVFSSPASSLVNVPMNVPSVLPGGAELTLEPPLLHHDQHQHLPTTKIKNERIIDDDDEDDDANSNSDDDHHHSNPLNIVQVPSSASNLLNDQKLSNIFGSRKQPSGLSISPVAIKKESGVSDYASSGKPPPQLTSNDFVAIPAHQIKRENNVGVVGVAGAKDPRNSSALSGLSSDLNTTTSSDDSDNETNNNKNIPSSASTLPMPGPGGTLQIPGVPAAITAVPYTSPARQKQLQQQQKPSIPSSLTVTPIDPLPISPKRLKNPRKKMKPISQPVLDTSDDEEDASSRRRTAAMLGGTTTVAPVTPKKAQQAPTNVPGVVTGKNPRGRPRKVPAVVPPPSQPAPTTTPSSAAAVKGPTLGAGKKDTATGATTSTQKQLVPPSNQQTTPSKTPPSRKRVSRQNSSASASNSAPSSNTTPTKLNTTPPKAQIPANIAVAAKAPEESDDESSTDSSSSTNSSSSSDSEDGSATSSSSDSESNEKEQATVGVAVAAVPVPPPTAATPIVGPIRPHSLAAPIQKVVENVRVLSSSSSDDDDDDDDDDLAGNEVAALAPQAKSSRSRVSTSCSSHSSSSSSSSSDESHGKIHKEKKQHSKSKPKSDKKSALTRIFNPKDGGAKRKGGQVLVVDQAEEMQQHQQHQQQQQQSTPKHHQEHLTNSASLQMQSPRPTAAGPTRSPRQPPVATSILAEAGSAQRTPNRSSLSAERKLQQRIKTPTRTPNRTPTPTHQLAAPPTASPSRRLTTAAGSTPQQLQQPASDVQQPQQPSIICSVELSRLRLSPSWLNKSTHRQQQVNASGTPPVSGGSERRTPLYDHESILNADLQATSRLKSGGSGRSANSGGSRGSTPRSTGNLTPNPQLNARSERELSRSRESLNELGLSGRHSRLDEASGGGTAHANGRLSSRSVDGGSTPKDLLAPPPSSLLPNGYTQRGGALSSGCSPMSGGGANSGGKVINVKHEHIKYEPDMLMDDGLYEAKYKAGVKEELMLKHDEELMAEKQKLMDGGSPPPTAAAVAAMAGSGSGEPKQRRKRSTSSSSSTHKEKRRKNEGQTAESQHLQQTQPTNHDRLSGGVGNGSGASDGDGSNSSGGKDDSTALALQKNVATTHLQKQQQQQNSMNSSPPQQTMSSERMPPPANNAGSGGATDHQQQSGSDGTIVLDDNDNMQQEQQQNYGSSTQNAQRAEGASKTQGATVIKVYRSHFEKDDQMNEIDILKKNVTFLQEAVNRKHAADRETNPFSQVALYLEAVVYFLLSGALMEQHRNDEAAWAIYRDTLALIKFISSKFRIYQASTASQHETHNKVAILSLRCQSLISLKLYKMKRTYCRNLTTTCNDYFKATKGEMTLNGNTPTSAISPSNSVCSQGSGSNTPPGRILSQEMYSCLNQQNQFFSYLASCHDLWEQADSLVRKGNHREFFIELDHENGPLTLHSTMQEVFLYVQSGLKRLKDGLQPATPPPN